MYAPPVLLFFLIVDFVGYGLIDDIAGCGRPDCLVSLFHMQGCKHSLAPLCRGGQLLLLRQK